MVPAKLREATEKRVQFQHVTLAFAKPNAEIPPPISHHILHIVELLMNLLIIDEPPNEHDYESQEALEHINRFVA